MNQQANAHWVVWMTLFIAVVMSILPHPGWLALIRPAWVLMVVIFWVLMLPERYGLFFAFIVGLLCDLLNGSLISSSAIGMLLVAFVVLNFQRRLQLFPVWQQASIVFILALGYQLVLLSMRSSAGQMFNSLLYLLPAISTALLWPWVMVMLKRLLIVFKVT